MTATPTEEAQATTPACDCGSTDFIISEFMSHKASVGKDGVVSTYAIAHNEIDRVDCQDCGNEMDLAELGEIQWN